MRGRLGAIAALLSMGVAPISPVIDYDAGLVPPRENRLASQVPRRGKHKNKGYGGGRRRRRSMPRPGVGASNRWHRRHSVMAMGVWR